VVIKQLIIVQIKRALEPKTACHITRQVSINARASVRYPI